MKKKGVLLPIIIIMSVVLGYILYVNAVVNADDTGTYVYMYNYFELGNFDLSFKQMINPWFISSVVAYLLNIGGNGAAISIAYLAVWYGIAVFFTLLIIHSSVNNKWLLALAAFVLIPYENTNRYHLFSTWVCLMLLFGIHYYQKTKKKWAIILGAVMTVYALLFSDDKMIVVLFIGVTLVCYYAILLLQDKGKHKFLYILGGIAALAAMLIKCIDAIGDFGITSEWGGYGGGEYLTWIDIATLFEKGIPSVFNSLLRQWNIPIDGGMIQFMSFYWIVRIVIAMLALAALFSRWIEIIKKGIKSLELIDALSVVCVTAVLGVNMCNGMIWYYELDGSPMNRYASICWFLLVVILARWIDKKFVNQYIYKNVTTGIVLTMSFVFGSLGYVNPIYKMDENVVNSYCKEEIKYLSQHENEYKYGLSSQWKSTPITAATNGEYVVDGGWISDGKLTSSSSTNYMDGTTYYNFIISDPENEMTVSPENIDEVRGDYVGTYSNTSMMYLYDYDIRFDERIVMECWSEQGDYELTDDITYNLDFPVGTNRIHMVVGNADNFNISIGDNPDIAEYSVQVVNDNEIYVDLVCSQNTTAVFNVGRITDDYTTIRKISLKRVRASVTVDENVTDYEKEIYLNEGSYIITFAGTDIDKMQVNWDVTGIEVKQLTDGKIKRRYQIDVTSPQTVKFNISGSDGMVIDKISYENAVLFDEED